MAQRSALHRLTVTVIMILTFRSSITVADIQANLVDREHVQDCGLRI